MQRIATQNTYDIALLGIYSAQNRQASAETQVSSGDQAPDFKGYASQAEALVATQTVASRLGAYVAAGSETADRLAGQDTALNAVQAAATGAGKAVLNAIATNSGATLGSSLQGFFSQVAQALNTNYQGQYLFAGGGDQPPVIVATVAGLSAIASPAAAFQNGSQKQITRIDDNINVTTGVLASDVGTPVVAAFKAIADYVAANGPFGASLTSAQTTFLQSVSAQMTNASTSVTQVVASNGDVQQQVADAQQQVAAQQAAAQNVISNITSADPAKAASELQLARVALEASAQVFSTLKSSSLLNVLSGTA